LINDRLQSALVAEIAGTKVAIEADAWASRVLPVLRQDCLQAHFGSSGLTSGSKWLK
jgi:hypothetical protein